MRLVMLVLTLLCGPFLTLAHAQNPSNPTAVEFDHPDFAQTDQYELGYFTAPAAAVPVQTATIAKPATCAPCTVPLASRPTQFATWWVAVRGLAGGATPVTSPWSNLVPFDRRPVAPTVRAVR